MNSHMQGKTLTHRSQFATSAARTCWARSSSFTAFLLVAMLQGDGPKKPRQIPICDKCCAYMLACEALSLHSSWWLCCPQTPRPQKPTRQEETCVCLQGRAGSHLSDWWLYCKESTDPNTHTDLNLRQVLRAHAPKIRLQEWILIGS